MISWLHDVFLMPVPLWNVYACGGCFAILALIFQLELRGANRKVRWLHGICTKMRIALNFANENMKAETKEADDTFTTLIQEVNDAANKAP